MSKRSLRLILPVCAALCVACEGYRGVEPEPHVLTSIGVKPADAALSTGAPGDTVQLSVWAYDQAGVLMPRNGAVTYRSSDTAIARVSSSGVVTAVAPGTAKITAVLTAGGSARTASMTVTVYNVDYSDIAGVYHLTALVTSFDSGWGEDLSGYRYTAVLTLPEEWAPRRSGATFADLQLIGPSGDVTHIATAGVVTGSIEPRGRLVIELFSDGTHGNRFTLTLIVETLASGFIDGTFAHGGIGGTFTARRGAPTGP
jgi:Bacterial Ig-like domain (group 2)